MLRKVKRLFRNAIASLVPPLLHYLDISDVGEGALTREVKPSVFSFVAIFFRYWLEHYCCSRHLMTIVSLYFYHYSTCHMPCHLEIFDQLRLTFCSRSHVVLFFFFLYLPQEREKGERNGQTEGNALRSLALDVLSIACEEEVTREVGETHPSPFAFLPSSMSSDYLLDDDQDEHREKGRVGESEREGGPNGLFLSENSERAKDRGLYRSSSSLSRRERAEEEEKETERRLVRDMQRRLGRPEKGDRLTNEEENDMLNIALK